MKTRVFEMTEGPNLVVKSRKSAVIFELEKDFKSNEYDFYFELNEETFGELLRYSEEVSNESWTNIKPKECNSFASDYDEYYDHKLDRNGYLSISNCLLRIKRPALESNRLYQFNKMKMQSFIYDFLKLVKENGWIEE